MSLPYQVDPAKLYHAYDGVCEGYVRFLGDGTADWYPGGSHIPCRRMAHELGPIGPVYVPLEDEQCATTEDDPAFDAWLMWVAKRMLTAQMATYWPTRKETV